MIQKIYKLYDMEPAITEVEEMRNKINEVIEAVNVIIEIVNCLSVPNLMLQETAKGGEKP